MPEGIRDHEAGRCNRLGRNHPGQRNEAANMAAPAEAPIIEPGEFLTEEHRINPFPLYQKIRDWEPVYRDTFQNRFVATRYADIWDAYKRSRPGGTSLVASTTRRATTNSAPTPP